MAEKVESRLYGIRGDRPLLDKDALPEARVRFIREFRREPRQIRLSPHSFNNLRALAERFDYSLGMDVKVERDMEDDEWMVCIEETKVFAVQS